MDRCAWPQLDEPYRAALEAAVALVFARFTPAGIVAAGRIVRGVAHAGSDLDIYVVNSRPERQRIQRWFHGVPAEIFVNPPSQIERYLISEGVAGRPCTAHMFSTGVVVYDPASIVAGIRARARALLAAGPAALSPQALVEARYAAADMLENALDIAASDPATALALAARAVESAVALHFRQARHWQPPWKETLRELELLDPPLAARVRAFHVAGGTARRIRLAREIVREIAGAEGFFEWESPLEAVE